MVTGVSPSHPLATSRGVVSVLTIAKRVQPVFTDSNVLKVEISVCCRR